MSGKSHVSWQPSHQESSLMTDFLTYLKVDHGLSFENYEKLHTWSTMNNSDFWNLFAKYCNINFAMPPKKTVTMADHIMDDEWFPGSTLNFAHHLLKRKDDQTAIIFREENGNRLKMSYKELYESVSQLSNFLRKSGIKKGDVIAAVMTNRPETVVAMLAASSIGAVWTSCSPDFGIEGIIDRIGQVKPKILFTVGGYQYGGKHFDLTENILSLSKKINSFNQIILVQQTQ